MTSSRRFFFLGASAFLLAPAIVRASSLMPTSMVPWQRPAAPVSEQLAEEAFAKAFQEHPRLTWEWDKGFRLGNRPVTEDEALRSDPLIANQVRACGEEAHKRPIRDALRAEFRRDHGPWKTDSLNPLLDDEASLKAWDQADALDGEAIWQFYEHKKSAGLLPEWRSRELGIVK